MHPLFRLWPGGAYHSTYAVLTFLGYAAGIAWLRTQVKNLKGTPALFWSLVLVVVGSGLAGGKLGFYLVEWRTFVLDPWTMLRDVNSGWVFWSGLLCGMLAGVFYQLWYNATHRPRLYLPVADYCIAALAIGHVFGRVGCFMEGCCHGRPTSLPWGVTFTSLACAVDEKLLGIPLHPTQLYEAGFEAVAAAVLIFKVLPDIRAGKIRYGAAFLGYVVYYSAMRFLVEFLRADDRGVLLSPVLSPSQWISLAAFIPAAIALWKRGAIERHPKTRSIYVDGKP